MRIKLFSKPTKRFEDDERRTVKISRDGLFVRRVLPVELPREWKVKPLSSKGKLRE